MEKEIKFTLTRPAKSKGGDRYEAPIEGESKPFVIYLPQGLSRHKGIIFPEMIISFKPLI